MKYFLSLILGICLVMNLSAADVKLKNGDKISGKLLSSGDPVEIETFQGKMSYPKSKVKKVKESTNSKYEKYLASKEASDGSVKAELKLAKTCIKYQGYKLAQEHLDNVEAKEPGNKSVKKLKLKIVAERSKALVAKAKANPKKPLNNIPLAAGKWLVDVNGATFFVIMPKGIESGKKFPVVFNYNFNSTQDRWASKMFGRWNGFKGILFILTGGKYNGSSQNSLDGLKMLSQVTDYDKSKVAVVGWRARIIAQHLGDHPKVFKYGYDDSCLGHGNNWSPPSKSDDHADLHVFMKLTGKDFKPQDPGFDDKQMQEVRDYWKSLGVKDVTIERYPPNPSPGRAHAGSISNSGSEAEARKWLEAQFSKK